MPFRPRFLPRLVWHGGVSLLLLAAPSCKHGKEPKPVVPGDPVVKCEPLPGAHRLGLLKSADEKTLLYEDADRTFVLQAFDMESRSTRTLGKDVRSPHVLADGAIVFKSKDGGLHFFKKNQTTPTRLTPENVEVDTFAVEELTSTIVFAERSGPAGSSESAGHDDRQTDIYKLPLEGGKPEKLTYGKRVIDAVPGEKAVLISRSNSKVTRLPLDGGEEKVVDIGQDTDVIGQTKGHVITRNMKDPKSKILAVPFRGGPPVELSFQEPMEDLEATSDGAAVFVYTSRPNGVVYRVDGATATRVLTTKGPKLGDVVGFDGDVFATLAEHDTNGDGLSDPDDEVDLCFIERHASDKLVEMPVRTVPLAKVPLAEKLAPLLKEPDLAGARLTFQEDENKHEDVLLFSPKAGSGDLAALRKRARELQTRVNELLGGNQGNTGVHVEYADGRFGESQWFEASARFLTYAGAGLALAAEPSEYDVDLLPVVGFLGDTIGICKGTVKNLGTKPLEKMTARCDYLDDKRNVLDSKTAALTPARLAPGATGTYRIPISPVQRTGHFQFELRSDEKRLSHYNSYASSRGARTADIATAVLAKTGLRYRYDIQRDESYKKTFVIRVQATEAFDRAGPEEQAARSDQALRDLFSVLKSSDDDLFLPLELEIVPGEGSLYLKTRVYSENKLRDKYGR